MTGTTFFSARCFLGAFAFVGLVAYAHGVRPDLDRVAAPLSSFFAGRTRGAMLFAYAWLSAALVSAAAKILAVSPDATIPFATPTSAALIALAAASLLPIALTARGSIDADTRTERIQFLHRLATRVAFTAIVVAMVLYSALGFPSLYRDQRALRTLAILVAVFAAAVYAISLKLPPGSRRYGVAQKLLVGLVVIWLWLIAAI